MNKFTSIIKIIFTTIFRLFLQFFCLFPLKKRIFFIAYNGEKFSCNPKYIYLYLLKQNIEIEYVWCFKKGSLYSDMNNVSLTFSKVVYKNSLVYFLYILTSKIIITNSGLNIYLPFRKKQLIIDTGHGGGAYKCIGLSNSEKKNQYMVFSLKHAAKWNQYNISSCSRYTDFVSQAFLLSKEKYINTGMPRNDIFFNNYSCIEKTTRKKLNIDFEIGLILYAPTYRSNRNNISQILVLDSQKIICACEQRFKKKFLFSCRDHYFNNKGILNDVKCLDLTNYPDMQELLCACDILITDFSSSVWDFSFTKKPGFLFTPDLNQYDNERGFYTPINKWPYQCARTTEDLVKLILNFDYTILFDRISEHHRSLGSYEFGNASTQICNLLLSNLEEPKHE